MKDIVGHARACPNKFSHDAQIETPSLEPDPLTPPRTRTSLTIQELAASCGLEPDDLKELERYGLATRDYPPIHHARWLTAGTLRHGLPVPFDEVAALESALIRVTQDAEPVAAGDTSVGSERY